MNEIGYWRRHKKTPLAQHLRAPTNSHTATLLLANVAISSHTTKTTYAFILEPSSSLLFQEMKNYVQAIDPKITEARFYRSILAVRQGAWTDATKFIRKARNMIDSELSILLQ